MTFEIIYSIAFSFSICAVLLVSAVFLHEFGHFILVKKYVGFGGKCFGTKVSEGRITINIKARSTLTLKQTINATLLGIFSGIMPFTVILFFERSVMDLMFIGALFLYLLGCYSDLCVIEEMADYHHRHGNVKLYRLYYFEKMGNL